MTKPFLRILLGPTASGKEQAALDAAQAIGGEIVSVDSMKIYRQADIGSAKPGPADRSRVRHHCLDLADPEEVFSSARYLAAAEEAIADISARGKPVILSGGTALYYKAILEGLFEGPAADPGIRSELSARAAAEGSESLHRELSDIDPAAAEKIHPRDERRLIRALEIIRLTGGPISRLQTQWAGFHGESENGSGYIYPCSIVRLHWPRPVLGERAKKRIDRMMEVGLEKEAERMYRNRDRLSMTLLQAVGYKEFFPYFSGEASLPDAVEELRKATMRLAKSQVTWFKRFPCHIIEMEEGMTKDALRESIIAGWARGLASTSNPQDGHGS